MTARDERLQEANAEIRRLSAGLNSSIHKFNDLATNHNAVVKDLNELRARVAKLPATNVPSLRPPETDRKQ